MKKIISILLALTLALSLCSTAWADNEGSTPTPANVAQITIGNVTTEYPTLQAAVDAATAEPTVIKLMTSCSGEGVVVPTGKNIVIDFNKCTYTLTLGVGSPNTRTSGFQLIQGSTVVMQNGKVDIVEKNRTTAITDEEATRADSVRNVMRLIQSYADVTLTDMVFDAANLYNLSDYAFSFNKGTVLFNGSTALVNYPDNMIAFDSCDGSWAGSGVYNGNPVTAITMDTTGTISGKVALGGGHLNVNKGTVNVVMDSNSPDLIVGAGANVTLDLCGKTLTGTSTTDSITNNGVLTIKDSSEAKTGKVESSTGKAPLNNGTGAAAILDASLGDGALPYYDIAGDRISAELNGTLYVGAAGIKAAIAAAKSGDTMEIVNCGDNEVVILENVAAGVKVKVPASVTTVKVNGYTLTNTMGDYYEFEVPAPTPDPEPDPTPDRPTHTNRRYPAANTTTTPTETKKDDAISSAKTFDAGVALYVGMALTSVTGMAWVGKKRGL